MPHELSTDRNGSVDPGATLRAEARATPGGEGAPTRRTAKGCEGEGAPPASNPFAVLPFRPVGAARAPRGARAGRARPGRSRPRLGAARGGPSPRPGPSRRQEGAATPAPLHAVSRWLQPFHGGCSRFTVICPGDFLANRARLEPDSRGIPGVFQPVPGVFRSASLPEKRGFRAKSGPQSGPRSEPKAPEAARL